MANEKRLIDPSRLIRSLKAMASEYDAVALHAIINALKEEPAVDAMEVVRCKDCKHYEIHRPKVLENCERNDCLIPMKPDDFCSYGERKDNG